MTIRTVALLVLASAQLANAAPAPDPAQLHRDGKAAFELGRYDDAIAAWERSYELSGATALTYNLGQAYRLRGRPGDCAAALAHYQTFVESTLEQSAPPPERPLAENYVAELTSCATAPAISAPVSDDRSARERTLHRREIAAVSIAGGGGVMLVVGLYFGYRASTRGDDVTALCAMGCEASYVESEERTGRREATIGRTLDMLGVAALVGGAALYWFGVHEAAVRVEPVATQHQPTGAVLSWSGTW